MFKFLPLEESHIATFKKWLTEDHIKPVWQEPEDEAEFNEKFLVKLPQRGVKPFIITSNDEPLGYIQYYNAHSIGNGWWENEPLGTYGIDLLIGEKTQVGKGVGPAIIKEFTTFILRQEPNVTSIIIDPEPTNLRAIKAFEKAGFVRESEIETPNGQALLMRISF